MLHFSNCPTEIGLELGIAIIVATTVERDEKVTTVRVLMASLRG